MTLQLRTMHITIDEIHTEIGRPVDPPLKRVVVAAVLANPWAGRGYVEDLRPEILDFANDLGTLLSDRLVATFGSADAIEAYGKCSVVGVDGELEHANAMVHTLLFGNPIRDAVDGAATLVFANTRGGPGSPIVVPLVHKGEMLRRTHYHTATASIPDAPRADEVVVALGGASGSRPFPRIGNRDLDNADIAAAAAAAVDAER
ncbi:MAG: amino acid synthesis family protein [Acidimicrobiia bacterium]|nr:amino acid synthesis family protein [Acidimicrobiia bacterium]